MSDADDDPRSLQRQVEDARQSLVDARHTIEALRQQTTRLNAKGDALERERDEAQALLRDCREYVQACTDVPSSNAFLARLDAAEPMTGREPTVMEQA